LADLTPRAETARAEQGFEQWQKHLAKTLRPEAEILEPVRFEYAEDLMMPQKEFDKLAGDADETDLYLVAGAQLAAVRIGERYSKPVAMVGPGVSTVDGAAYLRARGLEGFAPLDFDELNQLIACLRVRKAFQQMRILIIADEELITLGVVSSVWDLEDLKARLGIDSKRVPFSTLSAEIDRVSQSETDQQAAQQLVDRLLENAQAVRIDKEDLASDVNFYLAIRHLMEKYECNAVTVPCFELCATQLPAKWKCVPCLTHTLLKDEGYPSSCEGDLNVLLGMAVLMFASNKSSFMGNPAVSKDIVQLTHSVPGLRMNGFDKPDLPYELGSFTAAGWGTKVQIDLAANAEKEVTLARFNPLATKILVAKGRTVGCRFHENGCSPTVDIEVDDARGLIHKQVDFGHHLAMVYGDYTSEVQQVAELLGLEAVLV